MKVIINFRDPRAIFSSRKRLPFDTKPNELLASVCTESGKLAEISNNTVYFQINKTCNAYENFLTKYKKIARNVLLLRYEDFALHPWTTAQKVYEFLGLTIDASLRKWLESRRTDSDDNNPYSTHRNSSDAAFSWRKKITLSEATSIQSICR